MEYEPLALPEVALIRPRVFEDARGWFYESFNADRFSTSLGVQASFVQDNHSRSARGVLRGLHYQLAPHAQGKLVRVLRGAIFDVAVDIRRNSNRFGRWVGVELSESNRSQLWVPPRFRARLLSAVGRHGSVLQDDRLLAPGFGAIGPVG